MQDTRFSSSLADRTLKLLQDRPRHVTLAKIEAATGLKQAWLIAFGRGTLDGSAARVETLYVYLTGKPLPLAE